jgi:hypothetical protein
MPKQNLGNAASSSDAGALAAFQCRARAQHEKRESENLHHLRDIFNERRKELACEGDIWFDYVRLSYYTSRS